MAGHSKEDPFQLCSTEFVQHLANESMINVTEGQFWNIAEDIHNMVPGFEHTHKGHKCELQKHFADAAAHYEKAVRLGNAGATYDLALLYKSGKGVKKDVNYSIKLLEKAAAMPHEIKVGVKELRNVGVLEAQHALGLIYEEGVDVSKNCKKAAAYFKKAADKRFGNSAYSLAMLYSTGEGVPKDDKLMEHYLQIAVEAKNMNAALALSHYYMDQMEPQVAKVFFEVAVTFGHEKLWMIRNTYFKMLDGMQEAKMLGESLLAPYENQKGLTSEGITFKERMKRLMSISPEADLFRIMFEKQVDEEHGPWNIYWANQIENAERSIMIEIKSKAEDGFAFAKEMGKCFATKLFIADEWEKTRASKSKEKIAELLGLLYVCIGSPANFLLAISPDIKQEFVQWLEEILEMYGHCKGSMDMLVRLCYCYMNIPSGFDAQTIELLKEGVERYPQEIGYHCQHSAFYRKLQDHKKWLEVVEEGLVRFPKAYELLYDKALHHRLTMKNPKESPKVREVYQKFIEMAPIDHRKLPEAYYCIGQTYLPTGIEGVLEKERVAMIKKYYELGLEAEKNLLSCFLPYDSTAKENLEDFVNKKDNSTTTGKLQSSKPSPSASDPHPAKDVTKRKKLYKISGKSYLENGKRVEIIKKYRLRIRLDYEHLKIGGTPVPNFVPPKLKQALPSPLSLEDLKGIRLEEMNPSKEKIYNGRVLNLTIIDEPLFGMPSLQLVEDGNGDVTRIYIYYKPGKIEKEKLLAGSRIRVVNPYLMIAPDGTRGIRVDVSKAMIYMEKVKDICRYCGKENAPKKCSKCKRVMYCDKKCQEVDWKVLKHKLVCF